MVRFLGHALWIIILAMIAIGIFGWIALIFLICLVGLVFMIIYMNDNKKVAIAAISTLVAVVIYTIIYINYIME